MSDNLNEIWYSAFKTRVVYMPKKVLETFGESRVVYNLLTQLADGRVRLRKGVVKAARPRIVTPHYFASQALENFGPEARDYFEDLLQRKDGLNIMQYGLCFSKEDWSCEEIGGNIEEISDQLVREAHDYLGELRGVIIGSEIAWEASLVQFLRALVAQSVPSNAQEMAGRGMFALNNGVPQGIVNELDNDFAAATTRQDADRLGQKLRDYGLFDMYEARFFDLYGRFV